MKFTLDIPIGVVEPDEFQSLEAIGEMTRALEQAGADACFITDHPAPDHDWLHQGMGHDALDPFVGLAFIASASRTLMLHTNIVVAGYRNPFILAKGAASLHKVSGGRLILGLGAGYQAKEFEALGVDFHKRGKLFDEALEVIRLAWAGSPVRYEGMNFTAPGNEPRPTCDPAPRIWIGGSSPAALKRAGKHGDGWCPFFAARGMSQANKDIAVASIPDLRERLGKILEVRDAAGRTGTFDVAAGPPVHIGWSRKETPQEYVDAVGELVEAGVNWISATAPHRSRTEYIENMLWYGEEVIAKLRG